MAIESGCRIKSCLKLLDISEVYHVCAVLDKCITILSNNYICEIREHFD